MSESGAGGTTEEMEEKKKNEGKNEGKNELLCPCHTCV